MKNEIERLKKCLTETNPASEDYSTILANLKSIFWFEQDIARLEHLASGINIECSKSEAPVQEPTPLAEPVSATVVAEPEPVVTKTVEPKHDTTVTITKEYVRGLLSEASKNGIQIQPIVAKYVPEGKPVKFSEIPSASYSELVEELKNA